MNPTSVKLDSHNVGGGGGVPVPPIPAPGPMPYIVPPKKIYIPGPPPPHPLPPVVNWGGGGVPMPLIRNVPGGVIGGGVLPLPKGGGDINPVPPIFTKPRPIIGGGGDPRVPPIPYPGPLPGLSCPPCPPCSIPDPINIVPPVPMPPHNDSRCAQHQAPHGFYYRDANGQCVLTRRGGFGRANLMGLDGTGEAYSDFFGGGDAGDGGVGGGGVSDPQSNCHCAVGTAYRDPASGVCSCRNSPGGNTINYAGVTNSIAAVTAPATNFMKDHPFISLIAAGFILKTLTK